MVLTAFELISTLQHEVRILVHLTGKVDRSKLDYRPTAKQRSTIELLRYLSMMGPTLVRFAMANPGDDMMAIWGTATKEAESRDFDQAVAAIEAQADEYAKLLGPLTDADFRAEIDGMAGKTTRGLFLVTVLLGSHAAYRTQLFCYLKACGRDELTTSNLWAGTDPQPKA
jgi:hypothetical protein